MKHAQVDGFPTIVMSIRYSSDELHFLRDSPLVVKPPGLPPVEQWMGSAQTPPSRADRESTLNRAQADPSARNAAKQNDKLRNYESDLTADKRPAPERHVSRNSASTYCLSCNVWYGSNSLQTPKISFSALQKPPSCLRAQSALVERHSIRSIEHQPAKVTHATGSLSEIRKLWRVKMIVHEMDATTIFE